MSGAAAAAPAWLAGYQLDRVMQQNAALVEESAAAASSLKNQAAALSRSVQRFKPA